MDALRRASELAAEARFNRGWLTKTSGISRVRCVSNDTHRGLSKEEVGCSSVHTTPRARVQALLIRRWQETGELTLLHHRHMQMLLTTLRREKQLVAQELIGLMLDDLYEREA